MTKGVIAFAPELRAGLDLVCHYRKGVYVDGREWEDAAVHRQELFPPKWKEYKRRLAIFKEDGTFTASVQSAGR